jgi:hypothetical protein
MASSTVIQQVKLRVFLGSMLYTSAKSRNEIMTKIETVKSLKRLSPELVEVLSMLKALEKQDAPPPVQATR